MATETRKRTISQRAALIVINSLYAVSFAMPVTDAGTPQAMYGWQAFLFSLVYVIFLPMWLADPVFWIGCLSYANGRFHAARNAGLTAAVLAVSEVWLWDDRPEIGYWIWLASMLLLAVAGTVLARRYQNSA
jgi:hypothetical protein